MKLSIITINRNNAEGLKKTCMSVVTQTNKDFEWIVIDGASTDESIDIIKNYEKHIAYWVSEPDSGIYNAMNKGIKKTTGEYCLFLNSGDWLISPWTLDDIFAEINSNKPADVYYSNALCNDYKIWKYPTEINLSFLINRMLNHQNCLIKRELFNYCYYNEELKLAADWYFFFYLLLKYNISFFKLSTCISIYDKTGQSTVNLNIFIQEKKNLLKELNIKNNKQNIFITYLKKVKYLIPFGLYLLYKKNKDNL